MLISKKERLFLAAGKLGNLTCPVCSAPLQREEDSLRCKNRHSLDVNRKGFLNVLSRQSDGCYNEQLFTSRQNVFRSGCYLDVLQAIRGMLPDRPLRILDAGCGEGWWLDQLLSAEEAHTGAGVDISRAAILRAADRLCAALWLVGDLRRLPFADHSFDVILDVLTPASYDEFRRLLKPDGLLIKVYPGKEYLREIRAARGMDSYQDGAVDTYLREKAQILRSQQVTVTNPVTPSLWADFVRMTPLTQDLSPEALQILTDSPASTVTIDLHVTAVSLKNV